MGQPKHFGTMLRERRIAKGYSLRKFAELVDVSPTYLSLVETGKAEYPPSAERVRVMAEVLGGNWKSRAAVASAKASASRCGVIALLRTPPARQTAADESSPPHPDRL